ncbi:TetR/AcrR family transcriptional regulator [Marinomonas mediterranea]|jgi:transcriptional regulator, TetR family|uniref:Regulatory protein TetR n=1 Tax=Marinomonas mediterranea (strain ATCC 700492 / JCM 21426 / NBRC 103028 / MMB-1) TaxID=717774 RepID=F2JUR4_MARM1|nr:TetR/AcrR family transcriptional regulator [Marinomonas mediterranea]ADZ90479.1 regulatory protein TetR [Marinomonas mediterranea MMB-1]WCN08534.1 TetR family transcriptional regulator [Marinomonas mediterranea]WCN12588.1 TetR family transcriptional regulator [Marinomonas mediterranea]WCN16659.1 TetR family transcriptional regulator [Marinomonas mediterranea MMB-1]
MPKPYHHGDLYSSLINEADNILREEGIEALSIRRLAQQIGVSRTALYHHFKDKNDLLCALAESGFRQQREALETIIEKGTSRTTFEEYVKSYIAFATTNQHLYDLMYGQLIWQNQLQTDSLKSTSKSTFKRWISWVGELQNAKILDQGNSALRVGQACWASLHGFARLVIDGIYINQSEIEGMTTQISNMLQSHDRQ